MTSKLLFEHFCFANFRIEWHHAVMLPAILQCRINHLNLFLRKLSSIHVLFTIIVTLTFIVKLGPGQPSNRLVSRLVVLMLQDKLSWNRGDLT